MGMEIEKKIIKKNLDFSQTQEYFLDHIDGGGFLEKSLLQNIEFSKGCFFVLLPEDAKLDRLYRFSEGGINPTISTNEVHYVEGIGNFVPERQIVTSVEVSQFIKRFLEIGDDHFAICEDIHRKPLDKPSKIPNIEVHFYNDQVYFSLANKNSLEEINRTIRETDYIWHSLIVLSQGLKLSKELQVEDFSSICAGAQYVLTSAHDGENFIFWERID